MAQERAKKKQKRKREQDSSPMPPAWDERGLFLRSLAASWEAQASASAWRLLIEAVPMQPDAVQDEGDAFPTASCLVMTGPEPGTRRTMISVHDGSHGKLADQGHADREVEAHWRLEAWVGRTQATAGTIARSNMAGGYAAALQKMAELWPVKKPLVMSASASYLLNPELYKLHPSIPALSQTRVELAGRQLTADATMWEVSHEKNTAFITLTCPPSQKELLLIGWSGKLTCNFGLNILNELDTLVWNTISFLVISTKT